MHIHTQSSFQAIQHGYPILLSITITNAERLVCLTSCGLAPWERRHDTSTQVKSAVKHQGSAGFHLVAKQYILFEVTEEWGVLGWFGMMPSSLIYTRKHENKRFDVHGCGAAPANPTQEAERNWPHPICRSGAGCFQWLQPQIAHDEARFACSVLTDWGPQNFAEKKTWTDSLHENRSHQKECISF